MDIKKTVFLFIPIYLCGHIAQLKSEAISLNAQDPLVSNEVMKNPITATAVNNMLVLAFLVILYQYLNQVQQSELVIERVLIDRGQTRLKEFFNSSVDPIVVCSVKAPSQESADTSSVNQIEPEEILVCNDAAKQMLKLAQEEDNFKLREMAAATFPLFR